jgi:DNA-binding NarL/FixJ family response regulator
MRVAKAITLTDEERATLVKWSRGRSTPARLIQRAQIVLAAADGRENKEIAAELGCTRRTVGTWRNRFVAERKRTVNHMGAFRVPLIFA